MLEGFWVNDINKTGSFIDFDRDNATEVTQYELPQIQVASSEKIIEEAIEKLASLWVEWLDLYIHIYIIIFE